jgi:pyridoxal phosphate enzyme (YggS family)
MSAWERRLAENIATVRGHMAEAARQCGRSLDEVTLVAVTKYVDAELTRAVVEAGCLHLGESRPQEIWHKAETLMALQPRWHLIGHLQRNKVRRTLPLVDWIHSADSVRLLDSLQEEAQAAHRRVRVLLEVNVSRDQEKTGLSPEALLPLVERLPNWDALDICGLMAMSGLWSDHDQARHEFAQVRQLRDQMQALCDPHISLNHLSMGMSDDYMLAILEGATLVRVGSALFEGVEQ